jgi:hypothetical protein
MADSGLSLSRSWTMGLLSRDMKKARSYSDPHIATICIQSPMTPARRCERLPGLVSPVCQMSDSLVNEDRSDNIPWTRPILYKIRSGRTKEF